MRYGRSRRPLAEPAYSLKQFVPPAFRGSVSGVGSAGADVALEGGHRFVTQQVHQDVNADLCVGQFGGEGVPKTLEQSAFRASTVDVGLSEGAQESVL